MKAFAFEESWEVIRQVLPADREALARQSGSFLYFSPCDAHSPLARLIPMADQSEHFSTGCKSAV